MERRGTYLKRWDFWPLLALVPFVLIVLGFELLPAAKLVAGSFSGPDGGFTLKNYKTVLMGPFYIASMRNSLILSLVSTVLGLVAGLLAAYALSRSSNRVRQGLMAFISICVNFAGVPLAFAFIIILGSSGVLNTLLTQWWGINLYDKGFSLYSWTGLSLVYLYFQIPLATLLLYPAFHGIRPEWQEAATNLGASKWQFWWHIGLPVLAPAALGTFSILFANALGAYATAYALTTGIYNILPLRISRLISGEVNYDPWLASAAAVVLGAIMVLCLAVNQMMLKRYRGSSL